MPSHIETQRLVLRQFSPDDLEAYARMLANPDVVRYIGQGKPVTKEVAWRSMATVLGHWQLRSYGLWAVELKSTKQLIGRIGLYNPEGWPGLEVGWMLDSQYWGKGYAFEGAKASITFARDVLHVATLISLIQANNHPSIRLATRLGAHRTSEILLEGVPAQVYTHRLS